MVIPDPDPQNCSQMVFVQRFNDDLHIGLLASIAVCTVAVKNKK
jgi:hypothetical protein